MVKRIKTKTSIQDINFQKPQGDVKKSGNFLYPGNIVQRAPSITLGTTTDETGKIKEYTDPKHPDEKLPRRKHESNFFITLNTNRSLTEEANAPAAVQACADAIDELSQEGQICKFIKFGPKDSSFRNDVFSEVITKIEWEAAVETGEKRNRLHAHIWLTAYHFSQIQINMPVIQMMFKDAYNRHCANKGCENMQVGRTKKGIGRAKPFVAVKLLPSSDFTHVLRRYMVKGMASSSNT